MNRVKNRLSLARQKQEYFAGMEADSELQEVARRCLWWTSADEALGDTRQFLCHVMVYGLWQDAVVIRRRFGREQLMAALAHAPAGLFDLRSWPYWHRVLGLPVPPRPLRQIPGGPVGAASSKSDFHVHSTCRLTLGRVAEPDFDDQHTVLVASLDDIAATKLAVVTQRAAARDYVDVAAMLRHGLDLAHALACAKAVYRHEFDPMLGLKALSYFGDLPELPKEIGEFLAAAAAKVHDIREVQAVAPRITPESFRKILKPN